MQQAEWGDGNNWDEDDAGAWEPAVETAPQLWAGSQQASSDEGSRRSVSEHVYQPQPPSYQPQGSAGVYHLCQGSTCAASASQTCAMQASTSEAACPDTNNFCPAENLTWELCQVGMTRVFPKICGLLLRIICYTSQSSYRPRKLHIVLTT